MSDRMSGPIFVFDASQLHAFASLEEAAQALEPEDVRRGGLEIFDRSGRRLAPSLNLAAPAFCARPNQIHLTLVPTEGPEEPDRLRALIASALGARPSEEPVPLEAWVEAFLADH
jgi:hypothetical protein